MGLGPDRMDRWDGVAMKVAFMFPGQGSLEEGMGREIVEAVPEARQVFRDGSEAAGIDLEKLCFDTPMSELVETENQQPALVATCLAINEAIRVRGIKPDFVVGHSVGEFAALAAAQSLTAAEAIALVRERGLAMAAAARERPGTMAAILGLADEAVESICHKIQNVWPANYNCPGQIVVSGSAGAVEECCEEAEQAGARRAIRLRVAATLGRRRPRSQLSSTSARTMPKALGRALAAAAIWRDVASVRSRPSGDRSAANVSSTLSASLPPPIGWRFSQRVRL